MKNINDIKTEEEAHSFLTQGIADMAHLLVNKEEGLNKAIDFYNFYKGLLEKKYNIDVTLHTNAVEGILAIKARWKDRDIKDYQKELRESHEKVLDEKY